MRYCDFSLLKNREIVTFKFLSEENMELGRTIITDDSPKLALLHKDHKDAGVRDACIVRLMWNKGQKLIKISESNTVWKEYIDCCRD